MKRINHSTGSHIVVGNDSDIILMSLMCPVSQLYILSQETKGKSTKYNCISLDALNMRQSSDVLNATLSQVSVLCFQHCTMLHCSVLLCVVLCMIHGLQV